MLREEFFEKYLTSDRIKFHKKEEIEKDFQSVFETEMDVFILTMAATIPDNFMNLMLPIQEYFAKEKAPVKVAQIIQVPNQPPGPTKVVDIENPNFVPWMLKGMARFKISVAREIINQWKDVDF